MSSDDASTPPHFSSDPVYETSIDFDRQRPSVAVVTAVGAAAGRDPVDLEPLYDVIDPDALDGLLERSAALDSPASHRVAFFYAGYEVEIRADGLVRVGEAPDAPAASG